MKRVALLCTVALLVVALGVSCASAAKVLKLGHIADPSNPYAMGAQKFADLVAEKSGGEVEIQVFPSSQLGSQRDLVEGLTFGTVDVVLTGTAVLGNFLPEIAVFDLPFIFRDRQHAFKALDTVGMEMGVKLEPQGMKVLCFMENGIRNMTNNVRPIKEPEDMKGLKIRVMEQPVYIEMMKALGASPTPMAFSELFTSLQKGVIDGQENPAAHIYTKRFFEVQKYISKTEHTYAAEPLLISLIAWNGLTPEQQKAVQEAADEARDWQRQLAMDKESEFWQKIAESGKCEILEANEVNREGFQKATAKVWDMMADRLGKDNIEKVVNTQ